MFNKLKLKLQTAKKGYNNRDVWNMDYWFLTTIPKMLLELRERKMGIPMCKCEEVDTFPKNWCKEKAKEFKNIYNRNIDLTIPNGEIYDKHGDRFWLILTRIIWCFEKANPDNEPENMYWNTIWEDYYEKGKSDKVPKKLNDQFRKEAVRIQSYQDKCLNEGMDLLKKYFKSLYI